MTEDICGAECVDGSECRHPAGSCPVPSHSDPTAENPHGRPPAIDEDDHDDIIDAAQKGLSKEGCARAAGTTRDSLNRYLEKHPEFRADFTRARGRGEETLIREGTYGEADPSMTKFLLSTSFDYIKTERQELTGEDGGAVELSSDIDSETKQMLAKMMDREVQE